MSGDVRSKRAGQCRGKRAPRFQSMKEHAPLAIDELDPNKHLHKPHDTRAHQETRRSPKNSAAAIPSSSNNDLPLLWPVRDGLRSWLPATTLVTITMEMLEHA
ncbi:hypothetical protein EVAR_15710_1 [Eumeta japonica]|uniref:Uncharacterized protein n=1 Tax=Eumeta variegata TaxID=151549 RepID=A0A4C1UAV2_EUMVA|nr:hypothetical protein EVAR_15710_1 [Eumeta japonica]